MSPALKSFTQVDSRMSRFFYGILLAAASIGCGTPVNDTGVAASAATPVEFNVTGAPVVELEAPGMDCEACAARICKVVKANPGVVDVKADAVTKVVSVAVSEAEFESDSAIEAIAEAGFGEATLVEAVVETVEAATETDEG